MSITLKWLILEKNGKLHIPNRKCLAGSSFNICQCAKYLFESDIISYEELLKLFYYNPLKLLNLKSNKNDIIEASSI